MYGVTVFPRDRLNTLAIESISKHASDLKQFLPCLFRGLRTV